MNSGAAQRSERRSRRRALGGAGDAAPQECAPQINGPAGRTQLKLPAVSAATAAQGRRRFIFVLTIFVFLFGLVMVTSAGTGFTLQQQANMQALTHKSTSWNPWSLFEKQAIFGVLGFISLFFASRFPLTTLQRLAKPLLMVCFFFLMLVFIPGLAQSSNGATRWINLGPFQFQPSELIKLSVIIYVSAYLARARPPVHWMNDFVKSPGGVALFMAIVVFAQKDLGTSIVIAGTVMTLYMLAGTNPRLLMRVIGPGIALIGLGILSEPYRRDRFLAFLNPWHDSSGTGYQLVQGLISIGNGGVFGVGLGHSVQKAMFLPEAHTDMIFAITAEELGLFGVAAVLLGFLSIAIVGTRIALKADTRFNALLAAGLTTALVGQAIINLGGVVGVLPLTGVPLPLISYGGTNLLVSLTALGLLANIATASHATADSRHDEYEDGIASRDEYGDDDVDEPQPARGRRGRGHGGASGTRTRGRRSPA